MPIDKPPEPYDGSSRAAKRSRQGRICRGRPTIDWSGSRHGPAAIGLVDPASDERRRAPATAILGKPLGVGIYSAALKSAADVDRHQTMLAAATQLPRRDRLAAALALR
jgi:selenide,water dikinase